MTRRWTGPPSRSSGGWRSMRRPGSVRGVVRCRSQWSRSRRSRYGTTRRGRVTRTAHLHLQINARVFADGRWRGLHTVGFRDSIDALNGIGHAAVMTDPQFRAALAAAGFTLDPGLGRSPSWRGSSGRSRHVRRRSAATSTGTRPNGASATPARSPGRGCGSRGTARAWAEARPDKVIPTDGADLVDRWNERAHELGYRDPTPSPDSPSSSKRPRPGCPRPRGGGRDGAVAAGGTPVGVEPRRCPR